MACAGVTARFWSSPTPPPGRMPGVTTRNGRVPARALIAPASRPEAMTPSQPHLSARSARLSATSASEAPAPARARSPAPRLVSTVTATSLSSDPALPSTAARIAASLTSSLPWMVRRLTPRRAAAWAPPFMVSGMSQSLASRKILRPAPTSSSAKRSKPCPSWSHGPTLKNEATPSSAATRARA